MDLRSMDEIASAEADEYEALFKALDVPYVREPTQVSATVGDIAKAIAKLVARIEALEARPWYYPDGPND